MPRAAGRVAFVTSEDQPELQADDRLAAEALYAEGITVEAVSWSSPDARWEQYEGVVLRSCWDYYWRFTSFLEWIGRLERIGAQLWNPPALVRWNADKHYLGWLAGRGVSIIPTVWLEAGADGNLAHHLERQGWSQAVVKPTVSANGYQTWLTSRRDAAAHEPSFRRLLAAGGVMVQTFMPEVRDPGEWSFIFLLGRFSHAVLKRPAPGDFRTQVCYGGTSVPADAAPALVRQAQRVVDALSTPCLYARVDGCVVGGDLRLMELEVIEPRLFLDHHPQAPHRFAQAIQSVIGQGPQAPRPTVTMSR